MGKNYIRQNLTKKFDLNSNWKGEDRDEVIAHNRELWKRWKRENGGDSMYKTPEFLEYIDELHNFHGYSLTDIGVIFGLTGERMRQYFGYFDLKRRDRKAAEFRIWSDEKERFVTISPEDLEVKLKRNMKRKKEIAGGKHLANIVWGHINALRTFQKEHGKDPSLTELGRSLGFENVMQRVATYWGYSLENDISYQEAMDNFYKVAGAIERPGRWRTKSLV